jgi:hypothetical protein
MRTGLDASTACLIRLVAGTGEAISKPSLISVVDRWKRTSHRNALNVAKELPRTNNLELSATMCRLRGPITGIGHQYAHRTALWACFDHTDARSLTSSEMVSPKNTTLGLTIESLMPSFSHS